MWFSPSPVSAGALAFLLLSQATALQVNGGSDRLNSYLAAHPVATKPAAAAAPASANPNTLAPELVNLALSHCPAGCDESGLRPGNWTLYPRLGRLLMCNQTMLLDFSLFTSLRKDETIRACTASSAITLGASNIGNTTHEASCLPGGSLTQVQESLQLAFNETDTPATLEDFDAAAQQLIAMLSQREDSNCNDTTSFAYSNSVAVGLFAGSGVRGIPATVLQQLTSKIKSTGFSGSFVVQLCSKGGRSSKYSFGIVASGDRDVSLVQDAVATWASGKCITSFDDAEDWLDITLSVPSLVSSSTAGLGNSTAGFGNSTARATRSRDGSSAMLNRRAECSTIQVSSGDTCESLAAECGISPYDFTVYNPSSTLCSTLVAGQHVCCSAGTMPDFRPQPNPDGTCAAHYVVPGESCSVLGAANSLTNAEIESFNTNTWGWQGCGNVQAYQFICLSTGAPPMPAPIANAVCGPQKPGTVQPGPGTSLASLNPCPLNACCNKHGQCGINNDFCTESESETGAPGTSAPGENGCISNCGTDIVIGSAPAQYMNIGYFEGYNLNRPCLNMKITAMDLTPYTHIHLAFGHVSSTYAVDVSPIQEQWELFTQLSGFKKILSLGGWSFSAEPPTYHIFRDAVKPANQDTFVANIVSFVTEHELDGIDIDWEYPAAPDIPGIPPGTAEDADNYLTFFTKLRAAMPSSKSVSFCAPASFWYLKGYHIDEMASLADYIVYMTYDLHGQWDYANQHAIDGCPAGNCLRSQTNITETLLALAMITKAGVPSSKLAVGVTSYGRSFQMTTPGCTGPMCTYTGGESGAYPGPCTGTAGYIANAEINAILDGTGFWKTPSGALQPITSYSSYFDTDSHSNVAVYESTQWVGYMDNTVKADRTALYKLLNMGGVVDWAIDLDGFGGDSIGDSDPSADIVYPPPSIWDSSDRWTGCSPPCVIVFPPYPLSAPHTVTSWPALTTTLLSSAEGGGGVFIKTTTIPVPSFIISDVSLHPVTLQSTDTATYKINPVQSITPTSFVWTLPPNHATFPVASPTPTTSTDTDIPLVIIPPVTFHPTPVPVTIQPQPTYSIDYPDPPIPVRPVTIKPNPTPTPPGCTSGCGKRDCGIFGCGNDGCGLFGCGGGCGIFGCGGGCGPFGCGGGCSPLGCTPSCPLGLCGGPGCLIPGGCGNTQGTNGGDSSNDCEATVTASACTHLVTSYSAWYMASSTTTTETTCVTSTGCNGQDTVVKTTPGSPECSLDSDIAAAYSAERAADQTIIGGKQVPLAFAPTNGPGYDGSTFTAKQFGLTETITVIKTSTVTNTATKTTTVVVPPTATADCGYWVSDFFYIFNVYNIDGWSTDGGSRLKSEEKGCGALTGWQWHERTSTRRARAYFQLPFFMKSGCVERAIVSAGGPKLSCTFEGYDFILKKRSEEMSKASLPMRRRQLISDTASLPSRTETGTRTETSMRTETAGLYTPEPWGPGLTETFMTTMDEISKSTYTTEIVLASNEVTMTGTTSGTVSDTTTSTTSSTVPTSTSNLSTDGLCGAANGGTICLGTAFGDCCSEYGYCGDTSGHCGSGCQSDFGICDAITGPPVSTDGTCSSLSTPGGATCAGSAFGDCCSASGYCGATAAYCGTGCQADFGMCSSSGPPVSTDGLCGQPSGTTCEGSAFGDCCSEYGFCGATNAYCGTGCQAAFGTCA